MSFSVTGSVTNDIAAGYIGTSGLETVDICSITLPENAAARGTFIAIGKKSGDNEIIVIEKAFAAERDTGNARVVGNLVDIINGIKDVELITGDASLGVSGSNLVLSVTGVLTKDIKWYGRINLSSVVYN